MSDRHEPIDVDVKMIRESAKSIQCHTGKKDVWLPKSQIKCGTAYEPNKETTIQIPRWLAEAEGLV